MGDISEEKCKKYDKKYWNVGERKKFLVYNWQKIFDDRKTCNLVHKKSSDNGRYPSTNKTPMNRQIQQLQDWLDVRKIALHPFQTKLPTQMRTLLNPPIQSRGEKVRNKISKVNETIGEAE